MFIQRNTGHLHPAHCNELVNKKHLENVWCTTIKPTAFEYVNIICSSKVPTIISSESTEFFHMKFGQFMK